MPTSSHFRQLNMKYLCLSTVALATLFFSCENQKEPLKKTWLEQPVDFSQLREVTNTYLMYDSTGTKAGSMIFGFSFENGFLVARDTSQFDDGSVYETAEFTFDTTDFRMNKVRTEMKTPNVTLDLDLRLDNGRLKGTHVMIKDTTTRTKVIDSAYQFTNFREEIYMMIHTLSMKPNDTIAIQSLATTSISTGSLIYSGTETIETLNGKETCDAIWLKADGKMPDNKIWISRKSPRTIVKFYVPMGELNLVLTKQTY